MWAYGLDLGIPRIRGDHLWPNRLVVRQMLSEILGLGQLLPRLGATNGQEQQIQTEELRRPSTENPLSCHDGLWLCKES